MDFILLQTFRRAIGPPTVRLAVCSFLAISSSTHYGQTLPSAVSQQAVIDAQAQQDRERQKKLALEGKPEEKPPVEATEVSEDLGSLQLVRPKPDLPFARLHMDQSYSWLSNANYAKSSSNVVAAWQTISTIEGAWAPTFSTMPGYEKFTPEVGVRTSFFNYFSQEEPALSSNSTGNYDLGLAQDFMLMNVFFRANKQVTDELSVGLSVDVNGYFFLNTPDERLPVTGVIADTNFLNEITCAYSSNYFHAFTDTQAVTLSWRASYVFSNPSYFTRTDNSLTGSYLLSLTDKISLSPFASYRLAYYTDAQSAPGGLDGSGTTQNGFYRRLDQQYTLGLGLNFALTPQLGTGLNFNYSKSDSTSRIVETGDFVNLTAGANWSMTYKFSEKEFVVEQNSECLGPYTRVDLGFGFVNNLESSQTLTGYVLPGITGSLANPSISESLANGGLNLTGRYIQVPVILSSVFRWPGQGRWKPYLSTGFGFAYSQLQITQVDDTQTSDQFEEAYNPAFSVGSGFIWQVSDGVDFDVAYKLLGLINPSYAGLQAGVPLSNSVQFGINVRF